MHRIKHLTTIAAVFLLLGCQTGDNVTKNGNQSSEGSRSVNIPLPKVEYVKEDANKRKAPATLAIPADNIKISALTRASTLPTNTLFLASVISGSSSNSYAVPLEILGRAATTNSTTVYFYNDGSGKLLAYATNIANENISASANIAASKLDSTIIVVTEIDSIAELEALIGDDLLIKTEIDTQGEFEAKLFPLPSGGGGGSGDDIYHEGSNVTNPNFVNATNGVLFFNTSGSNWVLVVTNVLGSQIFDATIGAVDLGANSVQSSELDAADVEGELEAVIDLQDLQGQITDAQIAASAIDGGVGGEIQDGTVTSDDIDETSLEAPLEALLDLNQLQGQITDSQVADNAIDGGTAGEIQDDTITSADLAADSVGASELVALDVETELEAVLDLDQLQGNLSVSHLNSGTSASATTYWRGDGTWANPTASAANWTASGSSNSLLTGILYAHGGVFTNSVTFGVTGQIVVEEWPSGGYRTNAGSNVGITNYIYEMWQSNVVFNGASYFASGYVHTWNSNDLTLTHSANLLTLAGGDLVVPAEAYTDGGFNGDNSVVTKDAFRDYAILGDTDADGFWNILDPTGTAGWTRVNSSGVLQTPLVPGTGVETAVAIAVNTTGGFRTVGTKQMDLIITRPDYGDGTGAVPQTNTFNVSGLMHYTLSGNAETNANWVVYEFPVPPDFNTGTDPTIKIDFLSGGTDADDYVFHVTYATQAPGSAYVTGTSIATSPIVVTVTPTTAANGDLQSSAVTTLTGWAAGLTAGRPMQIRIARLQNAQDDGSRTVSITFGYTSTR